MSRPSFRRGTVPEVRSRVRALALLLVVAVILLAARHWFLSRARPDRLVVVEVTGEVRDPGFYSVPAPARARAAVRAAGGDPTGVVDAELPAGTRLVVEGGGRYRVERMDDLLVFGLPIDVNVAAPEALATIPGVGPVRAAAIVAEREKGGPFENVDDLDRVPGIGPATVDDLRPFVVALRP